MIRIVSLFLFLHTSLLCTFGGVHNEQKIHLPEKSYDGDGKVKDKIEDKKIIGLYFSASWCSTCRKFTPKLIDFRNQNLIDFEVILIGAERNKDAQLKYMQKFQMPWYAVDSQSQENQKVRQSVRKMLNLEFVPLPSLIILDKDGKILSATGKRDVVELGNNAISAWKELAKQG